VFLNMKSVISSGVCLADSDEFLASGYLCVYLFTISHVIAMEAINFVLVCETLMYALHKKR